MVGFCALNAEVWARFPARDPRPLKMMRLPLWVIGAQYSWGLPEGLCSCDHDLSHRDVRKTVTGGRVACGDIHPGHFWLCTSPCTSKSPGAVKETKAEGPRDRASTVSATALSTWFKAESFPRSKVTVQGTGRLGIHLV